MRQIRLLAPQYQITVAGFGNTPDAKLDFVQLHLPQPSLWRKLIWAAQLLTRQFEQYYWRKPYVREGLQQLAKQPFDAILANDVSALPLALKLAQDKPVLLDAHEYTPKEFEDSWRWRLFFGRYSHYLCQRYLSQVAGMTTVCQGIADEYARQYGVQAGVVYNAPTYQDLSPTTPQEGRIRLIHHGAAIRSRHMEVTIEVMRYLDSRFTLDFMLVDTDPVYLHELKELAKKDKRIRFIDPVPVEEISKKINEYDIGVFFLPPVNFNYKNALPNKLFEFIQARLMIAIGPSPEMSKLVKEQQIGVISSDFTPKSLANALNSLDSKKIISYKNSSHLAAQKLNFESSAQVWRDAVQKLFFA